MRLMLRGLLVERFGLALRSARRDAPVFALRVAKTGMRGRMRSAVEQCHGACDIRFSPGVDLE
jgi:uncharacterized protein (TIGR03435 family)